MGAASAGPFTSVVLWRHGTQLTGKSRTQPAPKCSPAMKKTSYSVLIIHILSSPYIMYISTFLTIHSSDCYTRSFPSVTPANTKHN